MAQSPAVADLVLEESRWAQSLLRPAEEIRASELAQIATAAQAVAGRLAQGARLMCFGAGHSWCIAAELCSRAGGLPRVVAMSLADIGPDRDQWLQLADSEPERDPRLAQRLLQHHGVTGDDALLIVTNSARNGMVVELARLAHEMGCVVVALVSCAHAAAVPSRHPSGAKVTDYADVVLDNHGVPGDAAVEIAPKTMAGATSTIAGALTVQLLSCAVARHLAATVPGFTTIRSANLDREEER